MRPSFQHELALTRHIYQTRGVFDGFYSGSLPNFTRMLLKNLYRYPLMISLPKFFEEHVSLVGIENRKVSKLLTGFTIAIIESLLICPVERAKVFFMTYDKKLEDIGVVRKFAT